MKRSTPRLAFGDPKPSFQPGLNTSVRLGDEWMAAWLKAGEKPFQVVLLNEEGRKIGTATVTAVKYMRLLEVPAEACLLYHDGPYEVQDLYWRVVAAYESARREDRRSVVGMSDLVSVVYFTVNDQE